MRVLAASASARVEYTPPSTTNSISPAPVSRRGLGPMAGSGTVGPGAVTAAAANTTPATSDTPTNPVRNTIQRFTRDLLVVGGVLEVHGVAEREAPRPAVVLEDAGEV